MISISLKENPGKFWFKSAFPKRDRNTNEQQKNEAGMPLWELTCELKQPESYELDIVKVIIAANQNPADVIEVNDKVEFAGLVFRAGVVEKNRWFNFTAEKMGRAKD